MGMKMNKSKKSVEAAGRGGIHGGNISNRSESHIQIIQPLP